MHDIRLIRENPAAFDAALARRGLAPMADSILADDTRYRALATEAQTAQARRNEASKAIGAAKAQKDEATAAALMAEVADLKTRLPALETDAAALGEAIRDTLSAIPNLPAADVPEGEDESGNVELKRWGTPRTFDFTPREHADFGPALGLDFETAAKMSGARFTFLRGQMARLERALGAFMLDHQTSVSGYTECVTPLLVREQSMIGTGQLPKFGEDSFSILNEFARLAITHKASAELMNMLREQDRFSDQQMRLVGEFISKSVSAGLDVSDLERVLRLYSDYFAGNSIKFNEFKLYFEKIRNQYTDLISRKQDSKLWLIPTAEVGLTNSVRETILPETDLPIRLTALTPCFRSEAGSAGRDTRGYIRQHQFNKVELVSITTPDQSDAEHERMTLAAEAVLEALELPYRRMLLCAGDMGFSARKTFDLEVWLPGQGTYREISSCSNCGDFQARRMDTRYRAAGEKGTTFVHTLNGSGLAVGRTLVAVLENYQQTDGSVTVPTALLPYMGGIERLVPHS